VYAYITFYLRKEYFNSHHLKGVNWIGLAQDMGQCSYKRGKGRSGSLKGGEFLEEPNVWQCM
jgi:hypothetical protein